MCAKRDQEKSTMEIRPDYYGKDDPYEPWKIIKAKGLDFFTGNALKYLLRAGRKDGQSYDQDIRKAITYLTDVLNQQTVTPVVAPPAPVIQKSAVAPVELVYQDLVHKILDKPVWQPNRTGVRTASIFNYNYELDLADGFPILQSKFVSWKNVLVENLWFLSGDRDAGLLHQHGCKIWDPWLDHNNSPPVAYGNMWKHAMGINQIEWVLNEAKANPTSRRLVVSAWSPAIAMTSTLPPCHMMFVLNIDQEQNTLNMHLTQRSCDVAIGLPYNIAGYAFLLTMFSKILGYKPGKFAHSIVNAHVYEPHAKLLLDQVSDLPEGRVEFKFDWELDDSKSPSGWIDFFVSGARSRSTATLLSWCSLVGYAPRAAIKYQVVV